MSILAPQQRESKSDIALAIMAKVPGFGPVKSRLAPRLDEAARGALATAFLQDKVAQLCALGDGVPLLAFTPEEARDRLRALVGPEIRLLTQRDGDLGARLLGVVRELLAEGFAGVILVDADTPNLPSDRLREAVDSLRAGTELVIGPAWDGGYYLLGLSRLLPELFRDIAWSTGTVLADTMARAEALGLGTRVLEAWYDVDEPADLERLERQLREAGPEAPALARHTREALGIGTLPNTSRAKQ